MKKLVKILAALTVAIAALAFIGCQDGFAGPDGTVVTIGGGSGSGSGGSSGGESGGGSSGGEVTLPAPAGTYNLASVTTDEGTLTPTDDGWTDIIDALGEDSTTIVIANDGITIMGTEFTWDEWEAVEDTFDYSVSGNNITVADDTFGTLVFTKA